MDEASKHVLQELFKRVAKSMESGASQSLQLIDGTPDTMVNLCNPDVSFIRLVQVQPAISAISFLKSSSKADG